MCEDSSASIVGEIVECSDQRHRSLNIDALRQKIRGTLKKRFPFVDRDLIVSINDHHIAMLKCNISCVEDMLKITFIGVGLKSGNLNDSGCRRLLCKQDGSYSWMENCNDNTEGTEYHICYSLDIDSAFHQVKCVLAEAGIEVAGFDAHVHDIQSEVDYFELDALQNHFDILFSRPKAPIDTQTAVIYEGGRYFAYSLGGNVWSLVPIRNLSRPSSKQIVVHGSKLRLQPAVNRSMLGKPMLIQCCSQDCGDFGVEEIFPSIGLTTSVSPGQCSWRSKMSFSTDKCPTNSYNLSATFYEEWKLGEDVWAWTEQEWEAAMRLLLPNLTAPPDIKWSTAFQLDADSMAFRFSVTAYQARYAKEQIKHLGNMRPKIKITHSGHMKKRRKTTSVEIPLIFEHEGGRLILKRIADEAYNQIYAYCVGQAVQSIEIDGVSRGPFDEYELDQYEKNFAFTNKSSFTFVNPDFDHGFELGPLQEVGLTYPNRQQSCFFRPTSKSNCSLDDPELIGRDVVGFRDTKSDPVPGTYIGSKEDGTKMVGVLKLADGTHVDVQYVQAEPVLDHGHTLDSLPDELSHELQSARANACGFFCMTKAEAASMLPEEKRVHESKLRDKMWKSNELVEVSADGNTWHKATVSDITNGRTRCICTGKSIPIMYPFIRQISDQQVYVQFMNSAGNFLTTNSIPLFVDDNTTAQETLTLALNKVGASTSWQYISNGGQNLPFLQYKAGEVLRQIRWDLLDVSAKHLANEVGIPVFTFVVAFQNIPQYTPHFSAGEIITILNPSISATNGYAAKFNSGFCLHDDRKNIREYLESMKGADHIRATVFQIGKVIGDYVTFEIISESYLYASKGVLTVDLTGKSSDVCDMTVKVGRKILRHRRAAGHLKRSFKLFRYLLITRNNQIIILQAMYKLLIEMYERRFCMTLFEGEARGIVSHENTKELRHISHSADSSHVGHNGCYTMISCALKSEDESGRKNGFPAVIEFSNKSGAYQAVLRDILEPHVSLTKAEVLKEWSSTYSIPVPKDLDFLESLEFSSFFVRSGDSVAMRPEFPECVGTQQVSQTPKATRNSRSPRPSSHKRSRSGSLADPISTKRVCMSPPRISSKSRKRPSSSVRSQGSKRRKVNQGDDNMHPDLCGNLDDPSFGGAFDSIVPWTQNIEALPFFPSSFLSNNVLASAPSSSSDYQMKITGTIPGKRVFITRTRR